MKGYSRIKEFIEDYRLAREAERIDPGFEGETLTSLMKKRIKSRLKNATKSFRKQASGYSFFDLKLIAAHESLRQINSIEEFLIGAFDILVPGLVHYRKLLKSPALQNGRLRRLAELIPWEINSKEQLLTYIKGRGNIQKHELTAIMSHLCCKKWRKWIKELLESGKIISRGGRWIA